MAKKTIISVDCEIPGELSTYVNFESNASLLDGDIILFNPSMADFKFAYESYKGKPSLSDDRSFRFIESLEHWRRELADAYRVGKTIFVLLAEKLEVYVDTGERKYSGTGRNRATTRIVDLRANYNCLPLKLDITASHGKEMRLAPKSDILSEYWQEFGDSSSYQVLLDSENGQPLIVTKSGDKTVGMLFHSEDTGGSIILLPYIDLWSDDFYEEVPAQDGEDEDEVETVSTKEGIAFGHKFLKSLIAIDQTLRSSSVSTPPPSWLDQEIYALQGEGEVNSKLIKVETSIEKMMEEKELLKEQLLKESSPKRLLFEKGPPLEKAILEALKCIGFEATQWRDSDSEFDAVCECKEGRLLGEAEGKDNKAISIEKLRQLEMNVLEDFERDEVSSVAKAVLFGNAYRLLPLDERSPSFTDKCLTAAKRSGAALVRTPDLFPIIQYLTTKSDKAFATKCRNAILQSEGEIVIFPPVPKAGETKTQQKKSKDS